MSAKRKKNKSKARRKSIASPPPVEAAPDTAEEPTMDTNRIELTEKLGIQNVEALVENLRGALLAKADVTICADKVEHADTAALQVLAAFSNTMRTQGRELVWETPADSLHECSVLLDLDRLLGFGNNSQASEDDGLCPVF